MGSADLMILFYIAVFGFVMVFIVLCRAGKCSDGRRKSSIQPAQENHSAVAPPTAPLSRSEPISAGHGEEEEPKA